MGKYPLKYYRYVVGEIVSFMEKKPELVEELIDYVAQSEKDRFRDLFNQY